MEILIAIKIQYEVWGGVTGHCVAMLKKNGVEVCFYSMEEAQETAAHLTKQFNLNPYQKATARYTAVEV